MFKIFEVGSFEIKNPKISKYAYMSQSEDGPVLVDSCFAPSCYYRIFSDTGEVIGSEIPLNLPHSHDILLSIVYNVTSGDGFYVKPDGIYFYNSESEKTNKIKLKFSTFSDKNIVRVIPCVNVLTGSITPESCLYVTRDNNIKTIVPIIDENQARVRSRHYELSPVTYMSSDHSTAASPLNIEEELNLNDVLLKNVYYPRSGYYFKINNKMCHLDISDSISKFKSDNSKYGDFYNYTYDTSFSEVDVIPTFTNTSKGHSEIEYQPHIIYQSSASNSATFPFCKESKTVLTENLNLSGEFSHIKNAGIIGDILYITLKNSNDTKNKIELIEWKNFNELKFKNIKGKKAVLKKIVDNSNIESFNPIKSWVECPFYSGRSGMLLPYSKITVGFDGNILRVYSFQDLNIKRVVPIKSNFNNRKYGTPRIIPKSSITGGVFDFDVEPVPGSKSKFDLIALTGGRFSRYEIDIENMTSKHKFMYSVYGNGSNKNSFNRNDSLFYNGQKFGTPFIKRAEGDKKFQILSSLSRPKFDENNISDKTDDILFINFSPVKGGTQPYFINFENNTRSPESGEFEFIPLYKSSRVKRGFIEIFPIEINGVIKIILSDAFSFFIIDKDNIPLQNPSGTSEKIYLTDKSSSQIYFNGVSVVLTDSLLGEPLTTFENYTLSLSIYEDENNVYFIHFNFYTNSYTLGIFSKSEDSYRVLYLESDLKEYEELRSLEKNMDPFNQLLYKVGDRLKKRTRKTRYRSVDYIVIPLPIPTYNSGGAGALVIDITNKKITFKKIKDGIRIPKNKIGPERYPIEISLFPLKVGLEIVDGQIVIFGSNSGIHFIDLTTLETQIRYNDRITEGITNIIYSRYDPENKKISALIYKEDKNTDDSNLMWIDDLIYLNAASSDWEYQNAPTISLSLPNIHVETTEGGLKATLSSNTGESTKYYSLTPLSNKSYRLLTAPSNEVQISYNGKDYFNKMIGTSRGEFSTPGRVLSKSPLDPVMHVHPNGWIRTITRGLDSTSMGAIPNRTATGATLNTENMGGYNVFGCGPENIQSESWFNGSPEGQAGSVNNVFSYGINLRFSETSVAGSFINGLGTIGSLNFTPHYTGWEPVTPGWSLESIKSTNANLKPGIDKTVSKVYINPYGYQGCMYGVSGSGSTDYKFQYSRAGNLGFSDSETIRDLPHSYYSEYNNFIELPLPAPFIQLRPKSYDSNYNQDYFNTSESSSSNRMKFGNYLYFKDNSSNKKSGSNAALCNNKNTIFTNIVAGDLSHIFYNGLPDRKLGGATPRHAYYDKQYPGRRKNIMTMEDMGSAVSAIIRGSSNPPRLELHINKAYASSERVTPITIYSKSFKNDYIPLEDCDILKIDNTDFNNTFSIDKIRVFILSKRLKKISVTDIDDYTEATDGVIDKSRIFLIPDSADFDASCIKSMEVGREHVAFIATTIKNKSFRAPRDTMDMAAYHKYNIHIFRIPKKGEDQTNLILVKKFEGTAVRFNNDKCAVVHSIKNGYRYGQENISSYIEIYNINDWSTWGSIFKRYHSMYVEKNTHKVYTPFIADIEFGYNVLKNIYILAAIVNGSAAYYELYPDMANPTKMMDTEPMNVLQTPVKCILKGFKMGSTSQVRGTNFLIGLDGVTEGGENSSGTNIFEIVKIGSGSFSLAYALQIGYAGFESISVSSDEKYIWISSHHDDWYEEGPPGESPTIQYRTTILNRFKFDNMKLIEDYEVTFEGCSYIITSNNDGSVINFIGEPNMAENSLYGSYPNGKRQYNNVVLKNDSYLKLYSYNTKNKKLVCVPGVTKCRDIKYDDETDTLLVFIDSDSEKVMAFTRVGSEHGTYSVKMMYPFNNRYTGSDLSSRKSFPIGSSNTGSMFLHTPSYDPGRALSNDKNTRIGFSPGLCSLYFSNHYMAQAFIKEKSDWEAGSKHKYAHADPSEYAYTLLRNTFMNDYTDSSHTTNGYNYRRLNKIGVLYSPLTNTSLFHHEASTDDGVISQQYLYRIQEGLQQGLNIRNIGAIDAYLSQGCRALVDNNRTVNRYKIYDPIWSYSHGIVGFLSHDTLFNLTPNLTLFQDRISGKRDLKSIGRTSKKESGQPGNNFRFYEIPEDIAYMGIKRFIMTDSDYLKFTKTNTGFRTPTEFQTVNIRNDFSNIGYCIHSEPICKKRDSKYNPGLDRLKSFNGFVLAMMFNTLDTLNPNPITSLSTLKFIGLNSKYEEENSRHRSSSNNTGLNRSVISLSIPNVVHITPCVGKTMFALSYEPLKKEWYLIEILLDDTNLRKLTKSYSSGGYNETYYEYSRDLNLKIVNTIKLNYNRMPEIFDRILDNDEVMDFHPFIDILSYKCEEKLFLLIEGHLLIIDFYEMEWIDCVDYKYNITHINIPPPNIHYKIPMNSVMIPYNMTVHRIADGTYKLYIHSNDLVYIIKEEKTKSIIRNMEYIGDNTVRLLYDNGGNSYIDDIKIENSRYSGLQIQPKAHMKSGVGNILGGGYSSFLPKTDESSDVDMKKGTSAFIEEINKGNAPLGFHEEIILKDKNNKGEDLTIKIPLINSMEELVDEKLSLSSRNTGSILSVSSTLPLFKEVEKAGDSPVIFAISPEESYDSLVYAGLEDDKPDTAPDKEFMKPIHQGKSEGQIEVFRRIKPGEKAPLYTNITVTSKRKKRLRDKEK